MVIMYKMLGESLQDLFMITSICSKYVTVITGQGKIKEEFELWVEGNDSLKHCELLPTNGAYRVYYNKEYR